MRQGFRWANEALAFFLEVVALWALGGWGWHVGSGVFLKLVLAVGLPLVAAVVWGLFAAPRAVVKLPVAGILGVKAVVFGAATLALYGSGHPIPAAVFAVLVVANTAIVTVGRSVAPVERDGTP
jgi:hypothetical protein